MAYKGTAGKSESGASMSKYDVEVESRLQALEKAIAELTTKCNTPAPAAPAGGVDALVAKLNNIPAITNHCSKDTDGVRRLKV
jgi:hypothetical protein